MTPEEKKLRAGIDPTLRLATELLGEQLASMHDCHDGTERISEVNRLLWELRWWLGILPRDPSETEAEAEGRPDPVLFGTGPR